MVNALSYLAVSPASTDNVIAAGEGRGSHGHVCGLLRSKCLSPALAILTQAFYEALDASLSPKIGLNHSHGSFWRFPL